MARNPRQTIRYRAAVVTFIDILGFRDLVLNDNADRIFSLINNLRSFGGVNSTRAQNDAPFETRAVNFSDSIVRIRYFDFEDGEGEGAIFYETLNLVHAQADLINQGIFVRGGMTVGSIYADTSNAFGPAFVRAYELESSYANFPRIIIGPEVFLALRSDPRLTDDVAHDVHYIRRLLSKGDDGLWFIDYLRAIKNEMDFPELHADFLSAHRDSVINGAARIQSLRTLQKYLWLATYHNKTCSDMYNNDNLKITTQDLPSLELLEDVASGINEDFD